MAAYILSTEYILPAFYNWSIQALHDGGNWGSGVGVCVIDSAILVQNPDQSNVISLNFASGTSATETHGQYVMSLLSAQVNNWGSVGICPTSRLVLANVESSDNNMYVSSIISALNYAASQASIDIISFSLGTTVHDAGLLAAINACYNAGKLVFAAAGNHGNYGITYPAYYPGVISVGSTNSAGTLSSFNTKNDAVSVFCPLTAGSASLILSAERMTNPSASLSRALIVQRQRAMFKLSCSVHSYVRPDNPCVSFNAGNPLAADPMLFVPQAVSVNTLTVTHKVLIVSAVIILSVFGIYTLTSFSSKRTMPNNKVLSF